MIVWSEAQTLRSQGSGFIFGHHNDFGWDDLKGGFILSLARKLKGPAIY